MAFKELPKDLKAPADPSSPVEPKCPDCGSRGWSQFDDGPLECMRCGTEWLVQGMHDREALIRDYAELKIGVDLHGFGTHN